MTDRLTLPVLPLREVVLFPGVTTVIGVGRPGTLRAVEAAFKTDSRLVFAVSQRENIDHVTPAVLYTMGTVARIGQLQRGLNGVQLLLQGELRATSLQYTHGEGYLSAVVTHVEEQAPLNDKDAAFEALYKEIRERAGELGERRGLPEEVVHQVLDSVTEPGRFADLVAGYLELTVPEKQGLLENLSVEDPERPGGRRLGNAAVGGGVVAAVPHHGTPGSRHGEAGKRRCQHHEEPGEPCGEPVDQIVKAGRGPAEPEVAVVLVPHHGVEGVDRLVGKGQHRPSQHEAAEGGDHPVGGIFRHRLHRGPPDLRLIQVRRVPSDDIRQVPAGLSDIPPSQGFRHQPRFDMERTGRQRGVRKEYRS